MAFLKKVFLALVALVVLLAVIGLFLPSTAHVERSAYINAPLERVFALVNDFREFNRWSPWAEIDPGTRYTYEGPASGVGAKMSWTSEKVGSGSQEIVESDPPRLVRTKLDFGSEGAADAFFSLQPEGAGTRVTWGFDTSFGSNLVGRYLGLLFDRWIGADYEKGLEKLKALAEAEAGTEAGAGTEG